MWNIENDEREQMRISLTLMQSINLSHHWEESLGVKRPTDLFAHLAVMYWLRRREKISGLAVGAYETFDNVDSFWPQE